MTDTLELPRVTNSLELGSDFVPTTHHDTYPYITPTGTELSGKSVLVTGASRGLGRAIAIRCAKAGCARIALLARSSLDSVMDEIKMQAREAHMPPPQLLPLQVDITSDVAVQAAAKEVEDAFEGQLDILVNNAGYLPEFKLIHESDPIEWWKAWEINVKGTFLSCHYLIPLVFQSDTRIVINISSIGGNWLMYGESAAYQASRLANSRFAEFLTRDYERQGLISISLHPGGVKTDMIPNSPEYLHATLVDEASLSADTVVWLCSERREWLNGRFVVSNWDMEELEGKKGGIVEKNLFKYRMTI